MKQTRGWLAPSGAGLASLVVALLLHGGERPPTGPATEKRFPPLKVPAGFKATLFACDPLIEYPSVIAVGPRPGAIFVAIDYMTGLGTEIVRRDEIRLVEDTDGDGYADKATLIAKEFNSIQGLAYHDGTLYVMHAPFLTALRDTQGTGTFDERRDLLTGLGLLPEKNPSRLHCANGVVLGQDGWLYLAMGDNGVDVRRPEGDRLVLHGGGILRCRPNGRDLHVFATGLRNIYDVALDGELNVFVRDNENDGGTYMIRVCHSFFGADHGYPYLYADRPEEALPPLADLGLGSSAGGVCYLERQFPPEYRGNLFFCEWGRSVVRYPLARAGSGFAPVKEIEFAAGAPNDPYGFRPTDIIVQRDGTMMISDWADGQRPKRGRGRIYHIAYPGGGKVAAKADDATTLRGRQHSIWEAARRQGPQAIDDLLRIVASDPEPRVRVQALRAVADLADPVLLKHKLDADPGDAKLAERLAALAKGQDARLMLEIVIALGRLRWDGAPDWLRQNLVDFDAALAHAAMQALRRSGNWPAVLKLVDEPGTTPIRAIALRALAERYEPVVIDGLITRLGVEKDSARRVAYADALTRVYKRPGPWVYWGYRPAPRPANTLAWEKSDAIATAIDRVLADPDRAVRIAILGRMQREKVPARLTALGEWLQNEYQSDRAAAILAALRDHPVPDARMVLEPVIGDRRHTDANRLTALALFAQGLDGAGGERLLTLAATLEDGPVLADLLRRTATLPKLMAGAMLAKHTRSAQAEVRAAAIEALGDLRAPEGRPAVLPMLHDSDVRVRRAAAAAAGKLGAKPAADPLVKLVADADPAVRRASLDSLRMLRDPRAVALAVAGLSDHALELTALNCLADRGGPEHADAVAQLAQRSPSADVLTTAVRLLTAWRDDVADAPPRQKELDRAVADIHGASGMLLRWDAREPVTAREAPALIELFALPATWARANTVLATGTEARVSLAGKDAPPDRLWFVYTKIASRAPGPIEFLGSSSGSLRVWLNGKEVYRRDQPRNYQIDSDRFAAALVKGDNRLLVQVGPGTAGAVFHLHFRRKSTSADHERLTAAALSRPGNPDRGRKLFFDVEKSLCMKCHRLGELGEGIGPDLTGIGSRFPRVYIVESILQPSRSIAPSFGTLLVSMTNGKVLTGVKVAETETTLTLADNQGQKLTLMKAAIDTQQQSAISTMPEGLEKRFTEEEFVDLIAFLTSVRIQAPK
jgi:putative membrane-bound dehydrogenase-like protein